MMRFENTQYLFLIFLLLPAYFLFFKRIKKIGQAYSHLQETERILKKAKRTAAFFAVAWIFLISALACPLWGSKQITAKRQNASVMFVADISKSMTVDDIKPSRIDAAKYFAHFLTGRLKQTACGLILAKGEAVLSVPLSFEHTALSSALDFLSVHAHSSAGSNLEAGILKALDSFGEERGNTKVIILLTDGDETKGSLLQAVNKIKQTDAVLIIIGIGTAEGRGIKVLDNDGKAVVKRTYFNEELLKAAANSGNGNCIYVNAAEQGSMGKVINIIDAEKAYTEKTIFIQRPVKRNFEMSLAAFLFFCIGAVSIYERKK